MSSKEYMKQWKLKNKEKTREYNLKYYSTHKQKANEQKQQYRAENKDHIKEKDKEWRDANKDKIKEWKNNNKSKGTAYRAKRRSILINAFLSCANARKIEQIYEQARKLTEETGIKYEVDHIVPLQGKNVCGFHVEWNLQILTKEENLRKLNILK